MFNIKKEVVVKPNSIIKNIIKPIKLKKDEKLICIVGDDDYIPPPDILKEISNEVKVALSGEVEEVLLSSGIKCYIVNKNDQIEFYTPIKLEKE